MENEKLYEERNKILADQRIIIDLAGKEKRELTADETTNYENMDKRFTELDDEIQKIEVAEEAAKKRAQDLADRENRMSQIKRDPIKPDPKSNERKMEVDVSDAYKDLRPETRDAFREFEKRNKGVFTTDEYRKDFDTYLRHGRFDMLSAETRALQTDDDQKGGYLAAPQKFIAKLIQAVDNDVFIRKWATVFSVAKAESIGVPALDTDPADPTWTNEIKVGSEDSSMDFEKREMRPHPCAQYIKVSKTLIRKSLIPIDALVRQRLRYKMAVVQENVFLNGTGANQPLGLFTASDFGISTGRDEATGNAATQIKADGLINAKYKLKAQYWRNCKWIFHRDAMKMIRKLKDGEGNYLWQPGLVGDRPSTILEVPYSMSEYCPNTFTTGEYVGMIGNFKYYWIVDSLDLQIQVVLELFALTNQNAYITRSEVDGQPVLEEAFVRVKLG